jgi:hypothetical protein
MKTPKGDSLTVIKDGKAEAKKLNYQIGTRSREADIQAFKYV